MQRNSFVLDVCFNVAELNSRLSYFERPFHKCNGTMFAHMDYHLCMYEYIMTEWCVLPLLVFIL